jgi:hypothetical protein
MLPSLGAELRPLSARATRASGGRVHGARRSDVAGALDDVRGVVASLLEVSLAEVPLVDAVEERLVGVDAVRSELLLGDGAARRRA